MVKPPLRTKSIGFKVSEEEYARLETAAQASGQTLGEWCREMILRGGASHDPALAEIIGVRLLLVNVLGPVAAGERVTPERFNQLLDQISDDDSCIQLFYYPILAIELWIVKIPTEGGCLSVVYIQR